MKPRTKNIIATKKTKIFSEAVIFRRSLIYQTKEFFQNSTLHGVRYIAETGRPAGEKLVTIRTEKNNFPSLIIHFTQVYVVLFHGYWDNSCSGHYNEFMGEVSNESNYHR